jgi:hypothetical protein
MRRYLCSIGALLCCVLASCVDLDVHGQATHFEPLSPGVTPREIVVAHDVTVNLSTGYSRKLLNGSVWSAAGSVPQGDVYKPHDTVFSVEGLNVHEAYLVLSGSKLVGYYLPAEHAYVSQPHPVDVPIR